MKKIKLLVASLLIATTFVNAQTQTSETFNYQAVARDVSGLTMNNQDISIQISVIDSETTIYTETHAITTTQFGMFTLSIGNGISSLGDFSTIDWSTGNYNVEVAMDEKGGSDYTIMGESALKAVPYAMHAKTAANVFSGDYNDLKNKPKGVNNKAAGDPWLWGGNAGTTNGVDFIGTTDAQDLDIRVNNVIHFRATQKGQLEVLNTGNSVFIGTYAGENDDLNNRKNTTVGYASLYKNILGIDNTAFGAYALYYNKSSYNTATGYSSLVNNEQGSHNTSNGYRSLFWNTTGSYNIGIGSFSLHSNISGQYNTANGISSLYKNTIGQGNVAVGQSSLYNNTTGRFNTATGYSSLTGNTTGDYNTALGYRAFSNGANYSNSTALGYNTSINGSNQVHLGNTSVTEVEGQVPYASYSDGRIKDNISENVKGLDFILKLRPVTYNFNKDRQDALMGIVDSNEYDAKYDIEKIVFSGFIAQEVEKAAAATNYNFSGVKKPKNDKDLYSLGYSEFVVPLVKAVQEQQQVIAQQKEMIEKLNARLDTIEKQLK